MPVPKILAITTWAGTPEANLLKALFGIECVLTGQGRQAVRELLDSVEAGAYGQQRRRDIRVLRLRFGIEPRTDEEKLKAPRTPDNGSRTLEEVALYYHVARERIRQIEARALKVLRGRKYKVSRTLYDLVKRRRIQS